MSMSGNAATGLLSVSLLVLGVASPVRSIGGQTVSSAADSTQAPTLEELRGRGLELIANQHRNDQAIDRYERIEQESDTTGGPNPRVLVQKKTRLVPNGAGTTKLLVEENGRSVTPEEYQRELQNWLDVLQYMVNPNDDRTKSATAKYTKRRQARTDLVDAMLTAFTRKWVGREMVDGHDCDVVELTPDPNFHPRSIFEGALPHAKAKIWVDHQAVQLVRARAQITSDIWVGGGVLGKLYKGGVFEMDQTEIAPGVWFPIRFQFDFSGRRFLFAFEEHQSIEASHYHYIGTPKDALSEAQSELASGKPLAGDP